VTPNAVHDLLLVATDLESIVFAIFVEYDRGTVTKVLDGLGRGGVLQLVLLGLGNRGRFVGNGRSEPLLGHVPNVVAEAPVNEFDQSILDVLIESVLSDESVDTVDSGHW